MSGVTIKIQFTVIDHLLYPPYVEWMDARTLSVDMSYFNPALAGPNIIAPSDPDQVFELDNVSSWTFLRLLELLHPVTSTGRRPLVGSHTGHDFASSVYPPELAQTIEEIYPPTETMALSGGRKAMMSRFIGVWAAAYYLGFEYIASLCASLLAYRTNSLTASEIRRAYGVNKSISNEVVNEIVLDSVILRLLFNPPRNDVSS